MTIPLFPFSAAAPSRKGDWQARRESNPQPAVLETATLPIELLACKTIAARQPYLTSRCNVRLRSAGQNFLISSRFVVVRLLRVVV